MRHLVALACAFSCASVPTERRGAAPVEPERFFCRYSKNPTTLPASRLSLSPGGAVFATVDRSRAVGLELTLPYEHTDVLRAAFTTGWVTYRTWLTPQRPLWVYPTKPQQVGAVLELGPSTPLEYVGLDARTMRVRAVLPASYRSVRPVELSLACEDTGIVATAGRWSDTAPDAGSPPRVVLVDEQDIPFSAQPGAPPEGVLRLPRERAHATAVVLEEQGDQVKVRTLLWPARLTGWVPRTSTAPMGSGGLLGGGGAGLGVLGGSDGGGGKPARARCTTEVPLYLARGGALEKVGTMHPKAAYEVVNETSAWTEISLPENAWLTLEPGLAWALKPGDLEVCRAPPQATNSGAR